MRHSRHTRMDGAGLELPRCAGGARMGSAAVHLREEADDVAVGGVRIVAPPDQPYGHRRRVAQAPEDDAAAPVLARRALGGHADATPGGDDGQPVVDIVDLLEPGAAAGWPQVGGGRPGAGIDGHDAVGEVGQPQLPPPGEGVVGGQRAVARLEPPTEFERLS